MLNHLAWRGWYASKFLLPQLFLSYFLSNKVATGPFRGMIYFQKSVGSVLLPKLTGTYEDELHLVLEGFRKTNYDCFINIGAAEGYYAVGVKKYLLPQIEKTFAFEATWQGRKLIKKLAKANGVTGIDIRGYCNTHTLSAILGKGKNLIICDIEGGEYTLLNPEFIDFSNSDILIETHPRYNRERDHALAEKFSSTHYIQAIEQNVKKLPVDIEWHRLIKKHQNFVLNEFRGGINTWLFLKSKLSS